ncbi:hypothetical protein [Rugamonas sp. DEMB1]|uniref:hypothetical protein n=1 Tax=Rugamonas sp. DEMB1 TaxID=3039386 RepID=UPI0024477B64|nr:hypothetical protein [Rugamonas sp. DEMB1]WGG48861.1 hypothetical protein QC826_19715 [Rugamonas sp. DEMB1]
MNEHHLEWSAATLSHHCSDAHPHPPALRGRQKIQRAFCLVGALAMCSVLVQLLLWLGTR